VTPDRAILALLLLPILAVVSLGFLARAFVDAGGNQWLLWLVVLALSAVAWLYIFTEMP
jgi:hypothetical protein